MENNFEQAFAAYFEKNGYDGMHAALVDIMYGAFRAGWIAAGGETPPATCTCLGQKHPD